MSRRRRRGTEESSGWLWKSLLVIFIIAIGIVFKMSLDLEPNRQIIERPILEQNLD